MKRILSILLVFVMCLSLLPLAALAEEEPADEALIIVEEEPAVEAVPAGGVADRAPALDGAGNVPIDEAHFPDKNFRACVSTYTDGNNDGILSAEEAAGVTRFACFSNSIQSLQGIEYFPALEELDCSYNQLTSLDVSGCTTLKKLDCSFNQLSTLDAGGCTALEEIECYYNQLTSLNLIGCYSLKNIACQINELTSLDVSGCADLELLKCYDNQLTSLDVSGCTALEYLKCNENPMISLNAGGCTALTEIDCSENQLTNLNVSGCTALKEMDCCYNQLTSLDVSGCAALELIICDENQLTTLNVSGCTALKDLSCKKNQLTNLDVSSCTKLSSLDCRDNQLTSLTLKKKSSLKLLLCGNNRLATLNLKENTKLEDIYCANNQLTSLDVSLNTSLNCLDCSDNRLASLDLTKNKELGYLDCSGNRLTSLDLTQNPLLEDLLCQDNRLTSLDISNCKTLVNRVKRVEPIKSGYWDEEILDEDGGVDWEYYLYCGAPITLIYDGESHYIDGGEPMPEALEDAKITAEDQVYTGDPLMPTPRVVLHGKTLQEGTDYVIDKYTKNTKVGTATITVVGIGDYAGIGTGTFSITPAPNVITAKSRYTSYSADPQEVQIEASATAGKLTYALGKGTDSSVKLTKKGLLKLPAGFVGTVKIKITATPKSSNYVVATKTVKVIVLSAPTLSSVKSGAAKQLTAKWSKISSASGYEVQCSRKKDFSSSVKTVTVRKAASTSKTITMKTANKKYFVRVRAYKVQDGVKYYSDWSNIKSVKVK